MVILSLFFSGLFGWLFPELQALSKALAPSMSTVLDLVRHGVMNQYPGLMPTLYPGEFATVPPPFGSIDAMWSTFQVVATNKTPAISGEKIYLPLAGLSLQSHAGNRSQSKSAAPSSEARAQAFRYNKGRCSNCHGTDQSFKRCSQLFINGSGCLNPHLGQLGDNGEAYRRWPQRMRSYRRRDTRSSSSDRRRNFSGVTKTTLTAIVTEQPTQTSAKKVTQERTR